MKATSVLVPNDTVTAGDFDGPASLGKPGQTLVADSFFCEQISDI